MALMIDMTTETGITVPDAYCRVRGVQIVEKEEMQFRVECVAAEDLPAFQQIGFRCAYDLKGGNVFEQAYDFLKGTKEFDGAVDC